MLLKNKIVLITGSSSGIGEACATHFAKAGAHVLLCARRIDKLTLLAAQLKKDYSAQVHVFALDIRHKNEVTHAIQTLPVSWHAIDIVVNNAGLALGLDPIQEGDTTDWDTMIDTNVKGLLYVTRAVLPQMMARNTGHIINLGSISSHLVYPKGAVYCATKFAVKALTEGFRMDLHGSNIRVTTIDPGMVETSFSEVRFKGDEKRAHSIYEGVYALSADDIADTIVWCATRPSHVNIAEVIITPTDQVNVNMVARKKPIKS